MKKPDSPKYRNLYVPADRDTIYYARVLGGRRVRKNTGSSPETLDGWKEAAIWRDVYEARKGLSRARVDYGSVPTFAELAPRYFESAKHGQLAKTTQTDRRLHLAATGAVMPMLGPKRVDEITADTLVDWWEDQAKKRKWNVKTGQRHLSSIAEVLKLGRRYLDGRALPTDEARERIGEQRRTAAGRADESGVNIRPIESPAAIAALLRAAREEGVREGAFVLTLLDAGLRRGEALALRWRNVAWGADEDDPRRHLVIEASRSRTGKDEGTTKSGRTRRVGLSRRLRAALADLFREAKPRTLDDWIFPLNGNSLRYVWARVADRAELPGIRPKDLRDTYASHLLTRGVAIQFVSKQLGHAGIQVTQQHYAKYLGAGGDDHVYVEPVRLEPGEIPADLLARLGNCSPIAHGRDPYALPKSLQVSVDSAESGEELQP